MTSQYGFLLMGWQFLGVIIEVSFGGASWASGKDPQMSAKHGPVPRGRIIHQRQGSRGAMLDTHWKSKNATTLPPR